ncbi:MAG: hypothetical protein ACM3NO_08970 [Deltaproteobacteria bacterium]
MPGPTRYPSAPISEAAQLDSFIINAGDSEGVLRGTRLDAVESLDFQGLGFLPDGLTRVQQKDQLRLTSRGAICCGGDTRPSLGGSGESSSTVQTATGAEWGSTKNLGARVTLKDGRVLGVQTLVDAPWPRVSLISKTVWPRPAGPGTIQLGNPNDLPHDGQLSFVLRSEFPATFLHDEKIEVGAADGSFNVVLCTADGGLILQDSHALLVRLDAAKCFGPSAFGPLRFRPVDALGRQGDWQPLVDLVRLPTLAEIRCAAGPDPPCKLSGTNLFLIESVSADPQFADPIPVPTGYLSPTLGVPRPGPNSPLYLKLRDDPAAINSVSLPTLNGKP